MRAVSGPDAEVRAFDRLNCFSVNQPTMKVRGALHDLYHADGTMILKENNRRFSVISWEHEIDVTAILRTVSPTDSE